MTTRLILPGIFAAAAHALVLLGFNNGNTPAITPGNLVEIEPQWTPPKPLPPEPPPARDDDDGPRPEIEAPARPVPVLDPVILNPRDGMETTPAVFAPDNKAGMLGPITTIPPGDYLRGDGDGKGGPPVLDMRFLDNTPGTRFRAAPAYPHAAKSAGIEGSVTVAFVVDEKGFVTDARVVESTHREFEEPTLRAVAKWRFEPGRKNGVPVRFTMHMPVVFSLSDSE
ncbi:MAG: energy transducer TonB [Opitutaceae bacterium]|jgi:protein TonB|nr:energy transducer TonB [Opitutaceae bacterium]